VIASYAPAGAASASTASHAVARSREALTALD
jgi:hypothetical protein